MYETRQNHFLRKNQGTILQAKKDLSLNHAVKNPIVYQCPLEEYSKPQKQQLDPKREDWMLEVEKGAKFSSSYGV